MNIFGLEMMVKNGLDFFFSFEIEQAPSGIPVNLQGPIQPFWADFFLHRAAAISEESCSILRIKKSRQLFLSQKWSFQELRV